MTQLTMVFVVILVLGAVSTLGQTFVIGLFMPEFLDRFNFSMQAFGTAYGVALAAASLALPIVAHVLWRVWGAFGFAVVMFTGAALCTFALTFGPTSATMFLACLFGLRLFARHGATLLMEVVAAKMPERHRDRTASLFALIYPFTLIAVPTLFNHAMVEDVYTTFWRASALVLLALALVSFLFAATAKRATIQRPPISRKTASLSARWRFIRSADFTVPVFVYILPLVADTILLLFLASISKTSAPLIVYALGQMIGIWLLSFANKSRISLKALLQLHLLPLLSLAGFSFYPTDAKPFILLGALGVTIGMSNVLGIKVLAERIHPEDLPSALSLRATTAMLCSSGAAVLGGFVMHLPAGPSVLFGFLAIAVGIAWLLLNADELSTSQNTGDI
jgi:MFS family permease